MKRNFHTPETTSDAMIKCMVSHSDSRRATRFPWLSALLVLLAAPGLLKAVVPQVSNIKNYALTHSSIRWTFKTQQGSYAWIRYGVSPGNYTYNTGVYQVNDPSGRASLAIGALKPGTTYYFRINVRPNANDLNDLCDADACGSIEQSVTTEPEPAVHPQPPAAPTTYVPSYPDTNGYVTVPMKVGATGECVAAADVSERGVRADDNLQKVINSVGFGTIIEFPQAAVCMVPPQNSTGTGYILPEKPVDPQANGDIDSPSHRWIILRTQSAGSADFAPWGARTTPDWAPKMAKFVAYVQARFSQVFDTQNTIAAHHFWFENLEVTHTADRTVVAEDAIDPQPFRPLINITAIYSRQETQASYIVLDRLYVHGQGAPFRNTGAVQLGGRNIAMIGCYIDKIEFWRMYDFPHGSPVISADGTTIDVAAFTYQRNAKESRLGMTAPASFRLSSVLPEYTGSFMGFLDRNGLTIRYTSGAQIDCTGCTSEPVASLPITGPPNAFQFFTGNIANGRMTLSLVRNQEWMTSSWMGAGAIGLEIMDSGTGPYLFSNNYLESYYMGFYIDAGGTNRSNDDLVWIRNHMIWNQNHRITSPTSNGFRYGARQLWELKRGKRFLLTGNLFQGNWSFQNVGPSIFLSGRPTYAIDNPVTGISDFEITNNIIRHASYGWSCNGASVPPPDPQVTARVLFANNLLYDINRYVYDESGPSFASGYMDIFPGCEDVVVRSNTMGLALGRGPYLMLIGGGQTLGEGLEVTDNIMYLSVGEGGGGIGVDDNQYLPITRRQPAIPANGTIRQKLDAYFSRNAATSTPSYIFANNVIVGGKTGTNAANLRDLTQTEVDNWAAQFPPGNFFPRGGSLVTREREVFDTSTNDFRLNKNSTFIRGAVNSALTGRSLGINRDDLESAMGLVQRISVTPGSTSAQIAYVAPDGNGCVIDLSKDGQNWNRLFDAGGTRERLLDIPGLDASSTYSYRLICYYEQMNDGERYTEYTPDQITRGTFSTSALVAASTVPVRVTATAPVNNNASRISVEYTSTRNIPSSWEQSPATKCTGQCSVLVKKPANLPLFLRWNWYNGGGQAVGSSGIVPAQGR